MGKKSNKMLRDIPKHSYEVPDDIKKLQEDLGLAPKSRSRRKGVRRLSDAERDKDVGLRVARPIYWRRGNKSNSKPPEPIGGVTS